jgi:hypothetical protein
VKLRTLEITELGDGLFALEAGETVLGDPDFTRKPRKPRIVSRTPLRPRAPSSPETEK